MTTTERHNWQKITNLINQTSIHKIMDNDYGWCYLSNKFDANLIVICYGSTITSLTYLPHEGQLFTLYIFSSE